MILLAGRPCLRSGHTLLEMMLSLVLLSIVMASVGSAVMFASNAIPDEDSPVGSMLRDSGVLSRIAEDLALAQFVIEQTDHAVTIVVPDCTGDGIPDRIRYAWSGVRGEPLFYQLNDISAVVLLDSIQAFSLDYTTANQTQTVMGELDLHGATKIAEYKEDTLVAYTAVTSSDWLGQPIAPTFDDDVVSFRVTKIELHGAEWDGVTDSTDPAVGIEIKGYDAFSGLGATTYTTAQLLRGDLTGSLKEAVILSSNPIVAGEKFALICYRDSSTTAGTRLTSNYAAGINKLTSRDSGASWDTDADSSLLYSIWATLTKQDKDLKLTRNHFTTVSIALQSAAVDRSPVTRHVRFLLAPQAVTAFWDADFSADPTQMDSAGDGVADWSHSGGSLPDGSLASGVWSASGILQATPMNSFNTMATADIRMKSETGEGALVYGPNRLHDPINLEDPYAFISHLRQDGEGGQELLFYNELTPTTPIASISGLPQGWIDLRLIVLPDDNAISIHVNGQEAGALKLDRVVDDSPSYTFALGVAGADAAFTSARVRVGGSYVGLTTRSSNGGYALELLE